MHKELNDQSLNSVVVLDCTTWALRANSLWTLLIFLKLTHSATLKAALDTVQMDIPWLMAAELFLQHI
jgi:hypothetical protein